MNLQPGHELDLRDGHQVGRLDHGQGQGVADLADRQNQCAPAVLLVNDLQNRPIDLEVGEVDRRNPLLFGESLGNVLLGDHVQVDENGTETSPLLFLEVQGVFQLRIGNQPFFKKKFTQFVRHVQLL